MSRLRGSFGARSEEHTSELQSPITLVVFTCLPPRRSSDLEGLDAELACLLIHRVGDLDVVEVPPAVVAAARVAAADSVRGISLPRVDLEVLGLPLHHVEIARIVRREIGRAHV